jgi:hypothetical protein
MRRFGCLLILALALAATGCESAAPTSPDYMSSKGYQARPDIGESLFPSDQAVIGNEAVEKILTSKVTLPARGRIAVLRLRERSDWPWWSEELALLEQEGLERLTKKLRTSDRVADASVLPSMLVPQKFTIGHLREAAARYQADMLLILRPGSHVYEKQKLIGPDEAKARCWVEAVLLDTRTGIVPFTTTVTEEYTARKSPEDFGFAETMRKAQLRALAQAFEKIGDDLATFLAGLPTADAGRPVSSSSEGK